MGIKILREVFLWSLCLAASVAFGTAFFLAAAGNVPFAAAYFLKAGIYFLVGLHIVRGGGKALRSEG